jgi:glycerophosphoryl diester phosphodiesterase
MLIDIKQWPAVPPVADVIARTNAVPRVSIGTFSVRRTKAAAAAVLELTGDHVCTALGPWQVFHFSIRPPIRHNWRTSNESAIVQVPNRLVSRRLISRAHDAGLVVFLWTINDAPRMRALVDIGVDGIMTDWPTRLVAALRSMSGVEIGDGHLDRDDSWL